jgi:DNA-binding NarL/FixJ family response regulator
MPRVWIHSPNSIVNDALAKHVCSLGFKAQLEPEPLADLALWNLCGQYSPFLPPPPIPTLALLCSSREEELVELLRLGYRGYHRPDDPPLVLPKALKAVLSGEVWAERHVIAQALVPFNTLRLTPKEAQVLSLLKLGLSNKQIAQRLGNSETTVKSHVSSLLEKFGVKGRTELLGRSAAL